MPGFLIFEEFGMDFEKMGMAAPVIKAALQRVPGSWMMHGIAGEKNVDVDPVAALNKVASGEKLVSGGVNAFFDPYKGWIPVVSVSQTVSSTAETSKRDLISELEAANQEMERRMDALEPGAGAAGITDPLPPPGGQSNGDSQRVYKTGMSGAGDGVERLTVEIQLDVSFPKILKSALKPATFTGGKQKRDCADIHLCTHASVDVSQVTMGSDSPAARMIQTLLAAGLADQVPYLSIHMTDVSVAEVNFNLLGETEDTIPTATITLEYEEIKWTYHILNGSNMNLFDVDFEYDVKKRSPPPSGFSLGNLLNPFT